MKVRGRRRPRERRLSHSSRGLFANCRRKYFYSEVMRLNSRDLKEPLIVGGVVHDELDEFYRRVGQYGEDGILVSFDRIRDRFKDLTNELAANGSLMPWHNDAISRMEAVCCGVVAGYVRRYEEEDAYNWEIVEPEQKFKLPILDTGWVGTGRLDLIVRLKNKKGKPLAIVEHKTASRIDRHYVAKIAMDKQTLRYVWAAQQLHDEPINWCVYNVIAKPPRQMRQRKGESPQQFLRRLQGVYEDHDKYFYREVFRPTREQVQSIPDDDRLFVKEIERAEKTGYWYQNSEHCYEYNATCPFMRLCVEGVDEMTLLDFDKR